MVTEENIIRHWTEIHSGARTGSQTVLVVATDIDLAPDAKGYIKKDVIELERLVKSKFDPRGYFNQVRLVPYA